MTSRQELDRLKQIYKEESIKILMDHDVIFHMKGLDSDIKIVFVEQDEYSPEEVTFEMLENFKQRIQKEINPAWYVGIFFTDIEAADTANRSEEEYQL